MYNRCSVHTIQCIMYTIQYICIRVYSTYINTHRECNTTLVRAGNVVVNRWMGRRNCVEEEEDKEEEL